MTLEEAKKMLEEEGFSLEGPGKPSAVSEYFLKYESPDICEAMQIVCSAGYMIMMFGNVFESRKERLQKEYEENTKAPGSAENRIKEDSGVNPALKEAASQFNDALLDEQAKKIKRLGKEITRLNKVIHKKNMKIEEFRKESSRQLRGMMKMFVENVDLKKSLRKTESLLHDTREANSRNLDTCFKNEGLIDELKKKLAEKTKLAKKYAKELSDSSLDLCKLEKQLKDKDAVLSDVAEELRLTRIREKNLAELGLKYVGENEKLKKKLADKIADEIDARVLKSAESALAYKEKVITEKDEVIADLGNELAATKKELEEKTKLVEAVRESSKEDREYGIAAEKMIQKMAKVIVGEKPICSEDVKEYRRLANGYMFNPQLPEFSEEELMKIQKKVVASCDIAEEGGDHSCKIVICGKDFGKLLKENEKAAEELYKVLDDVIDQFLLFGEIIIKEEK